MTKTVLTLDGDYPITIDTSHRYSLDALALAIANGMASDSDWDALEPPQVTGFVELSFLYQEFCNRIAELTNYE